MAFHSVNGYKAAEVTVDGTMLRAFSNEVWCIVRYTDSDNDVGRS